VRSRSEQAWGEGCSPVLYKDKLVILRDNRGQSTIQVLMQKMEKLLGRKTGTLVTVGPRLQWLSMKEKSR